MRKISATMVSQHPDHANKPYWHSSPFIKVQDEIEEAHRSFFDIGSSEYKWDWEGKFVDESVVERLLTTYFDDFSKAPLGVEKFLTFRLPNPKVQTEFRLGRAFMGIIGAAGLAETAGLQPPLFEVILPMTETSREMIDIQEAYQEMNSLKHPLLKITDSNKLSQLELIPLFEQVEVILDSDKIIREYLEYYLNRFGEKPEYMRPYVARSDPALNSGLVPTVLAIKVALSKYHQFEIPMYPIIGSASLPFRGGLTPYSVEQFASLYKGVRTALIQSAFRYDYDQELVKEGIRKLEEILPTQKADPVSPQEEKLIREMVPVFEGYYRPVIEGIAGVINLIAGQLPKRRERVQHVGLFGYSRGVGSVKLPRAIGFTAALYNIGAPPEIIGTGRALKEIKEQNREGFDLILTLYPTLVVDLQRAGRFVNKAVITALAKDSAAWKAVWEDVQAIETVFGIALEPETPEEQKHAAFVSSIYSGMQTGSIDVEDIEAAAKLRKSLG